MSVSTAIGMVGESLRTLLEEEMSVTPVAPVTLLAPDETGGGNRRINLFLYKIQENTFLKNKDWEVSRTNPARVVPPPLSLNLYYLLTPYAQNDLQTGNTSAHEILGDAMRVLYQFPVVPGEHLAPGLADAREQIKIMQMPLDLDEISKVWSTFSTPYRLSVMYEVAVVQLDPADGEQDMPTRVSSIGVPDVRAPLSFPKVSSITPVSGPVATIITINGDALDGWRAYVDLGNQRIADGVDISGDSFTVTVPAGMAAGFHRLRINISNLHRSTFYFEVTP
jgi:hypothetical protein